MLIPDLIYMSMILTMAIIAFLREGRGNKLSSELMFFRSYFIYDFEQSLGCYKFYRALALATVLIMSTYTFKQ